VQRFRDLGIQVHMCWLRWCVVVFVVVVVVFVVAVCGHLTRFCHSFS
jgi:hypothetical protein